MDYEKTAIAGGEMPDKLSAPDKWMFLCLRTLYGQIRTGSIDRAMAIREKKKLLEEYRIMRFQEETRAHISDIWKRVEIAVSEYQKNPNVENADRVIEYLYGGVKRKENGNGC